jgi:hypothetical protein
MENLKPAAITAALAFLAAGLIYVSSPSLEGLADYQYALLVPIFTSVVAVSSLYFIYSKLSEVMV